MTDTFSPTLSSLAAEPVARASWWVSVVRALDQLDDEIKLTAAANEGHQGAFAQAVARQPGQANATQRLVKDRLSLTAWVRRLRRRTRQVAGQAQYTTEISAELASLARAQARFERRARAVFWESFNRDIGGE